ncbi:MAG: hypothetical protein KF847_21200, partial [Pirellulales bacterium]|nr:hypothetical protein [Pirellulales bacterium]
DWTNPFSVTTTNPAVSRFPSGDGSPSGEFAFVFTVLNGDASADNIVNSVDFGIWNLFYGQTAAGFQLADFTGDGHVNGSDFLILLQNYNLNLRDLLFADFNGDGWVDGDDFDIWDANYGARGEDIHHLGDANNDGIVDGSDFMFWQRHSSLGFGLKFVK